MGHEKEPVYFKVSKTISQEAMHHRCTPFATLGNTYSLKLKTGQFDYIKLLYKSES